MQVFYLVKPLFHEFINQVFLVFYRVYAYRLLQLKGEAGSDILYYTRGSALFSLLSVRQEIVLKFVNEEDDASAQSVGLPVPEDTLLGDQQAGGAGTTHQFMGRYENGILINVLEVLSRNWFETLRSNFGLAEPVLGHSVHVDVLVGAGGRVVEEGEEVGLVAHHTDTVHVEHSSGDICPSDEGSNLDGVSVLEFVQLHLEVLVVEVAALGHRDHHDMGTALSPWDQVGVVLEHRVDDDGLVRVHSEVGLVHLFLQVMDRSFSVAVVGLLADQHDLAQAALEILTGVLLAEVGVEHQVVYLSLGHGLGPLADGSLVYFLTNDVDHHFVNDQIRSRSGPISGEDADVVSSCSAHPLDDLTRLLSGADGLSSSGRLLAVSVGVERQDLLLNVFFNEPQAFG
mmetsp:Transcript_17798/g.27523  ORF Transcript_17798/g.27523 Transcript_17798/m.27523 type:complete len:399 (-) Transcript_17798:225-1421(-)